MAAFGNKIVTFAKGTASAISTIGEGIGTVANGLAYGVGTPLIWTAKKTAKTIQMSTAGLAVGIGYPLSVVSGVVAVSSGIYALGPCLAYNSLPKLDSAYGFAKVALSPLDTTVQLVDAALCPLSLSTFATMTTVSLLSYTVARCARRAFN